MKYPQLPDSEFFVMQIIWDGESQISSREVAKRIKPLKGWKNQTVYTLLGRLVEKGFLFSEKHGWERYYEPLVKREDYLRQETGRFVEVYHKNSLTDFMSALVPGSTITDNDLSELSAWLKSRENEDKSDV